MRFATPAVLVGILLAFAAPANSETLSVRPSVEVTERYDSNVINAPPGRESSDFATRITPRAAATVTLFSTELSLVGGFDAEYYARHSELDRSSMTKNLDLSTREPMRLTPGFSLRPAARYIESRDSVRRNQLSQTTVQGLAPSDTQVAERVGTRDISGSLNGTYAASELMDLGFGIGASRRSYLDAGPSFIGAKNYSSNASVDYKWTPTFTTGGYGTASYDEFDNQNDVRNFSAGLSGRYLFSPASSVNARLGITWVRDDNGIRESNPSGRIEYAYSSGTLAAFLSGSIDYASGSFGNETRREELALRASDRISANWSVDASGVWQANRSLKAPFLEDLMSVQAIVGAHYALTEYARLNLSGELFRQWNRGGLGTDLYRNSIFLGIDVGSNIPIF